MRERVVRTHRVHVPAKETAVIEVVYVTQSPGRVRRALAGWLLRLAGRCAMMRVRVLPEWDGTVAQPAAPGRLARAWRWLRSRLPRRYPRRT